VVLAAPSARQARPSTMISQPRDSSGSPVAVEYRLPPLASVWEADREARSASGIAS
jgi:hypothetical protein